MQLRIETAVGLFILVALGLLVYMSFQIGSLRFATYQYAPYYLYFADISGLNKKADVKIAGVKVGWIDEVHFEEQDQRVKARVMILRKYHLFADAYGIIRQNGLLGGKYLEIVPGDPTLPVLTDNNTLGRPAQDAVSVDDILKKFKSIAAHLDAITDSMQQTLGGDAGARRVRDMVDGFSNATQRIASCAESIDRLVCYNEQNVNEMLNSFKAVSQDFKNSLPDLQKNIGQLSNTLDREFERFATQLEVIAKPFSKVLDSYSRNRGLIIKHKFRLF